MKKPLVVAFFHLMMVEASQDGYAKETPGGVTHTASSEAIEDNSFLIEEAFNQEDKVVQHISNGVYFTKPQGESNISFTQEWPLSSPAHQMSYTVPYSFVKSSSGIGDVLIHYRYQLFGKHHRATTAPRLSVIFPTGDPDKEFGDGAMGLQFNLPLSARLCSPLILHLNAGSTFLPNVKRKTRSGGEGKHTLSSSRKVF